MVVRIDTYEDDDDLEPDRVTVTSVFSTEDAAEADAARLNQLANERGLPGVYITRIGRFKSD